MQTFLIIALGIIAIIIIVEIVIHLRPSTKQGPSPNQAEVSMTLQHPDELRQLLLAGKKIQAIKVYRQITGVGLKEAKEAIDRMADGTIEVLPPQEESAQTRPDLVDAEKLQRLIRDGHKIEAIKYFRQQRGVGLKEAKEAVDWLEANMHSQ